jgi:threonine dehydratase
MSISFADIEAAAGRLEGHAVRTPLIESAWGCGC